MSTPKSEEFYTTPAGIRVKPGMIVIPQSKYGLQRDQAIREQPLTHYREFYKSWDRAAKVAGGDPTASFGYLLTHDPEFCDSIMEALGHLGIENPELILPSQLIELVYLATDASGKPQPGLLFTLHQDVSRMPAGEVKPSKKTKGSRNRSTILKRLSGILKNISPLWSWIA